MAISMRIIIEKLIATLCSIKKVLTPLDMTGTNKNADGTGN